jgi:putative transposase
MITEPDDERSGRHECSHIRCDSRSAASTCGDILDIQVQSGRDKKAAKKFFRKLLKGLRYVPHVIITDKLRSYSAAKAEVLPDVDHLQQKYQNNRADNSHQPTRLRETVMRRFKSAGHAQRFLSAFGIITSHFRVGRHL